VAVLAGGGLVWTVGAHVFPDSALRMRFGKMIEAPACRLCELAGGFWP
jgi:hypothetical protein